MDVGSATPLNERVQQRILIWSPIDGEWLMSERGASGESRDNRSASGRSRNGGDNNGNNGKGHHHSKPPPDPGPPAIQVEIFPASLIDISDPDKLASFIDQFQSAVAAFAATLQSAGLDL